MTTTTFVNGVTLTDEDWFNDVDRIVYDILGDPATAIATLNALTSNGIDVASASTINLTTATGDFVDVTGTTTITAVTLADGDTRTVRFTGALTLTHGASLVLPGAANITTVAGDYVTFRGYAAGVVRALLYTRTASGSLPGAVAASQAQQEAASDLTVVVTPGRQKFHPSAVKAAVFWNSDGTYGANYNVSSVTDNGVGVFTLNFTVAFSSSIYVIVAITSDTTPVVTAAIDSRATGSCQINARTSDGTLTDSSGSYSAIIVGDQ